MLSLYRLLKYLVILAWSAFIVAPFLWALTTSFKTAEGVVSGATYIPWLQYRPSLEGWGVLFRRAGQGIDIVGPYFSSLFVTLSASAISLVLGTMAAYGLSRFTFRAGPVKNKDITFFFISQRIMPPVVLSIPFFLMLKVLGLLDTELGLILVYIALLLPIAVWVMIDFFNNIPRELDETAMLDGCSPVEAFWRIILPNCKAGLVVAGLFCVIFGWNDFFFAFVLTFTETQLLPVAVVALNSSVTPWWSLSASALISVAPLVGLAFTLEKYLSRGDLVPARSSSVSGGSQWNSEANERHRGDGAATAWYDFPPDRPRAIPRQGSAVISLIVEGVTKVVDEEVHLRGIDLALRKGAFYILLGPTLAGKTSLMRLLAGLDRPTAGRILMDGRDLAGTPVWKRRVSMVYQQFINYPHLTVYDNIAFPLRRAGKDEREVNAKVRSAAAMLHIEALLDRRPGEISGGQQQRAAIARALVKGAELLILDEPLINLDFKLREQLRDEFKNIFAKSQDTIIVYSTADPLEALLLGGEVIVLDKGRLLQSGPTHKVFRNPETAEVARIFSDPPMNMIDGAVEPDRLLLGTSLRGPLPRHFGSLASGRYRFGVHANDLGLGRLSPEDAEFKAIVELAEVNGSETFIHVHHNGVSWVIQENGIHAHSLGQTVSAYLDPNRLFAFDEQGRLAAAPRHAALPLGAVGSQNEWQE
jgi:multiple sugar transport system permease protein